MRRWFKVYEDANGSFFYHGTNENAIFLSFPHKELFVEILNKATLPRLIFYSGSQAFGPCAGVTPDGEDFHLFEAWGDTHIIGRTGNILDGFLNGFLDIDGNRAPPMLAESFVPPSIYGG